MQLDPNYCNQWNRISTIVCGRTDVQIKNHWKQHLKVKHEELSQILEQSLQTCTDLK